ncbi:hypothetical protein BKA70DRAFT_1429967 [Coprinopsis sp. MPI-PUGE-AT-0042]|nr:hypothetical protein BKA70DRAFT_1429967 [Coprinopsis sp. MPI-PUGE-AT-0042]
MPKGPKFEKIASHIRGGSIPWMECVVENWPPSGTPIEIFNAFLPRLSIPDHGATEELAAEGKSTVAGDEKEGPSCVLGTAEALDFPADQDFHSRRKRIWGPGVC